MIHCQKCNDNHYFMTEDGAIPCECVKEINRKEYIRNSQIPPLFRDKEWKDVNASCAELKKICRQCLNYAKNFNISRENKTTKGLLLQGGVGRGKTLIACLIAKMVIDKVIPVVYYNISNLFKNLRNSYRKRDINQYDYDDIMDKVLEVPLLILDDVGATKTSEWTTEQFYLIIDNRLANQRPVIITTNCSDDELENRIGYRFLSRTRELCEKITFPDDKIKDYRLVGI